MQRCQIAYARALVYIHVIYKHLSITPCMENGKAFCIKIL